MGLTLSTIISLHPRTIYLHPLYCTPDIYRREESGAALSPLPVAEPAIDDEDEEGDYILPLPPKQLAPAAASR